MRLFFALWPPRETALALEQWAQAVEGRRTPAGNIHLTLAFLGEADEARARTAALRVQAAGFRLPLEEARHWSHNSIVWAGPHRAPAELMLLVEALQVELYKEAFILERRPFAAHVTLMRKAREPAVIEPLPGVKWPVREFALVSSARGAYEDVERFPLAP